MLIEKKILSVSEASAILSCSDNIVYSLLRSQALRGYKDFGGRRWRVPAESITSYIDARITACASLK
ncbi:MAG: helix-turn-helix domain-containing protein [Selenomonadaceae bacterium]|nr:helix-turn-helix domain-containing protein [Selenomonadaceae bacterium]